jgi:hypothetical protein
MQIGSINDVLSAQLSRNQFNSMDSLVMITQRLVARMEDERREQAVNFERSDLVEANRKKAKLLRFKARVADNVTAATKAKTAIEWASRILGEMKTGLQSLLGSTDPAARTAGAAAFNSQLADLNSRVDGANQMIGVRNVNLIGNTSGPGFATDDIFSATSERGGQVMIEGVYMGTHFNIEDAEGFLWRYDDSTNDYVQFKSDSTGERTGSTMSAEGLTVTSYDHDTGAVQFGGSGSLSGTVVQGGIGVLTSEFYSDFADDAAIQQAIDDIDAAVDTVAQRGAPITADATLIDSNVQLVNEKVRQLDDERRRIMDEELDATAAVNRASALKMRFTINNINILSQMSSGLVENMMQLTNGPSRGPGVFGILGL